VSITYDRLPKELRIGDRVLIDDGRIDLRVEDLTDTDIVCRIVTGGELSSRKGINIPNVHLNMPYISEQDELDLRFGIEMDVDFVAASFVRSKNDVIELRKLLNYYGGHSIKIIAKIENAEGVENFDEILANCDGIMVARGDMGVEIEFEKLPGIQKKFIRKCYQAGKMVITATQMLESMITHSSPTRAEITDVANAVFDGTSAVMLSGETAVGKYPLKAIEVMAKVAKQAERDVFDMKGFDENYVIDYSDTTNAMCDAACTTAKDLQAKAIVALTMTGRSARRMSKFRPSTPIVAATPSIKTYNQLALSWGVYPVLAKPQTSFDSLFLHAIDCAKQIDLVSVGDQVVIVGGVPIDTPGNTNIIKVETVKSRM
jgi:pyruvate kinase